MSDLEGVLFEKVGEIATITLDRPAKRNAINITMSDALREVIARFEEDDDIRVAILTGSGGHFCAGMDLAAFIAGEGETILFGKGGFGGFVNRKPGKPVIAAVEGAALAGGFEILLACDMAIAGEGAIFGVPEPKLGLIAGGGGAIRLRHRVPQVIANEILLTGRMVTAEEAHSYGLLNAIVKKGGALAAAQALAQTITANAPDAITETLALARNSGEGSKDDAWKMNNEALRRVMMSAEAKEGISAFLEKRPAKWPQG
jgi:enoyl-CoA hydratase